ncbi:hypothetical protein DFJ73DRAFT_825992 [Zopfochytrium polystomum]|nr:hypothetical protein DFJ73DRAFT_825992 [Zopfochytrium polystomum]
MAAMGGPVPRQLEAALQRGRDAKAGGNQAFKAAKYGEALRQYYAAIMLLKGLDTTVSEGTTKVKSETERAVKEEVAKILIDCYNNMGATHLRLKNWRRCKACCDQVLENDPENTKALFRRGQSLLNLGDIDAAEIDLESAARLDPKDSKIQAELRRAREMRDEDAARRRADWRERFANPIWPHR